MLIKGKRVLVTGGAGFVGGHLVDLLARHNRVTVLDDFSVGSRQNLVGREQVAVIEADVRDRQSTRAAVEQADVVFHLATVCLRVSLSDPVLSHDVNDIGSLEVLLAARECGVDRFVYVSSSEVYGNARWIPMDEDHPTLPSTPYGASKLAGEAMTLSFHHTYGLPAVVVRPFNIYGPRSHAEGPSGESSARLRTGPWRSSATASRRAISRGWKTPSAASCSRPSATSCSATASTSPAARRSACCGWPS